MGRGEKEKNRQDLNRKKERERERETWKNLLVWRKKMFSCGVYANNCDQFVTTGLWPAKYAADVKSSTFYFTERNYAELNRRRFLEN